MLNAVLLELRNDRCQVKGLGVMYFMGKADKSVAVSGIYYDHQKGSA